MQRAQLTRQASPKPFQVLVLTLMCPFVDAFISGHYCYPVASLNFVIPLTTFSKFSLNADQKQPTNLVILETQIPITF